MKRKKIDVLVVAETNLTSSAEVVAMANVAGLTFVHAARSKTAEGVKPRRVAINRRPRAKAAAAADDSDSNGSSTPPPTPPPSKRKKKRDKKEQQRAAAATSTTGELRAVGGGVGILARAGISITRSSFCIKGGISISGETREGSCFGVIGLYLPPPSSRRSDWREDILSWATLEYEHLEKTLELVVIAGDLNCPWLNPNGDRHVDPEAAAPSCVRSNESDSDGEWRPGKNNKKQRRKAPARATAGTDTRRLYTFCGNLNLQPMLGIFATRPAVTTSRSGSNDEHRSESDYILANISKLFFWPLLVDPWDDVIAEGAGVHRLVGCTFVLPPPQLRKDAATISDAAAPPPRARVTSPPIAHYGSAVWQKVCADNDAEFAAILPALADPAMTFIEAEKLIAGACRAGAHHLEQPNASLRVHEHRRCQSLHIPREAVDMQQQARALRHLARRANGKNKSATAGAPLYAKAKNLLCRARQIVRTARKKRSTYPAVDQN